MAEGVSGDAELSLLFVDEEAIAELNGRFMDADGPTDVLAFPIDDPVVAGRWPDAGTAGPDRDDPEPGDLPLLLGDVVVCPAVAQRQAPAHAGSYDDELALLVVHGVLHVLGPRPRRARGDRGHAGPRARAARPVPPSAVSGWRPPLWPSRVPPSCGWSWASWCCWWLAAVLAAAEAALTRVTRPRAEDLAAEGRRHGDVLAELVRRPEQSVTTVVFLRIACQLVQATLVGILANRAARPGGRGGGDRRRRRGRVRPRRDRPEDLGDPRPRAGGPGRRPPRPGARRRRPAAVGRPGADRPDQRGPARQGAQAGPVRVVRGGAAGRRRDRRRRGGHRGGASGRSSSRSSSSATRSCAR